MELVNNTNTLLSYDDRKRIAEFMRILSRDPERMGRAPDAALKLFIEADKFERCRKEFARYDCTNHSCGESFSVPVSCNSRICPECARRYWAQMNPVIRSKIDKTNAWRPRGYFFSFVTLTWAKAWDDRLPTRSEQAACWKHAAKLLNLYWGKRKARLSPRCNLIIDRRSWKGCGWIAVNEFGAENNNFHVHAVVFGHRVPYNDVRRDWERITGGAKVLDIQPIVSPADMQRHISYILKYMYKQPVHGYARLAELAFNMKGLRRFRTGGILYNSIKVVKNKIFVRCPYCRSQVSFNGFGDYSRDSLRVKPLYELLKLVQDTGLDRLPYTPFSDNYDEGDYISRSMQINAHYAKICNIAKVSGRNK